MMAHAMARVRGRERDQRGFALLATLVVIVITSVLVLAALSLSFSSTVFSGQQVVRDRETRAADSAIDVGINTLQRESTTMGAVTDPATPCSVAQKDANGHPSVEVDGTPVVLTCTPVTADAAPVPLHASYERVMVVGDKYHGQVATANADPCAVGASCMPWSAALGSQGASAVSSASNYAANGASVVASGPGALTFSSDVTVHKGTAAVRNPTTTGTAQAGPAVAVSGLYRQGDAGLLDTGAPATNACGVQSHNDPRAIPSVQITSILQEPVCSSPEAQAIGLDNSLGQPFVWGADQVNSVVTDNSAGGIYNPGWKLPATCPSYPMIHMYPGSYGPVATARLNQWFKQGNCDNKVFWFDAGPYYFDVDDAADYPSTPNALVFDDPTSLVVFGTPNDDPNFGGPAWGDWSSVPDVEKWFPKPCFTNDAGTAGRVGGVTITLSSRTSIRHEAGRVSICDQRTTPNPQVAIWQSAALTAPWGPVSPATSPPATSPGSGGSQTQFTNTGGVTAVDGNSAQANGACDKIFIWIWDTGLRECDKLTQSTISIPAWSQAAPTAPSPIDTLTLNITGSAHNVYLNSQGKVVGGLATVRLVGPNVPTGSCLVTTTDFAMSGPLQLLQGDCADKVNDARMLVGTTVQITWSFQPHCTVAKSTGPFGWWSYNFDSTICRQSDLPYISVDGITLTAKDSLNVGGLTSPFLVTSDVGDDTSFNVYGQVSIPRGALDIDWKGDPTSDPMFNGTLVVDSLGSRADSASVRTGIVCCVVARPSERVVQLAGWTDVDSTVSGQGRLLSLAQVAIEDRRPLVTGQYVYIPGEKVRIDDWRLCAPVFQPYPVNDEPAPNSLDCRSP